MVIKTRERKIVLQPLVAWQRTVLFNTPVVVFFFKVSTSLVESFFVLVWMN